MELAPCVADLFDQRRFDAHMHVFEFGAPAGPAFALLLDFLLDLAEAALDLSQFVGGDQLLVAEHVAWAMEPVIS